VFLNSPGIRRYYLPASVTSRVYLHFHDKAVVRALKLRGPPPRLLVLNGYVTTTAVVTGGVILNPIITRSAITGRVRRTFRFSVRDYVILLFLLSNDVRNEYNGQRTSRSDHFCSRFECICVYRANDRKTIAASVGRRFAVANCTVRVGNLSVSPPPDRGVCNGQQRP